MRYYKFNCSKHRKRRQIKYHIKQKIRANQSQASVYTDFQFQRSSKTQGLVNAPTASARQRLQFGFILLLQGAVNNLLNEQCSATRYYKRIIGKAQPVIQLISH